jgi:hypothetical protein
MIPTNTNPSGPKEPTPEMLAGVNVRVEAAEDLTIIPCCAPEPTPSLATSSPSVEQLVGHYILVEGEEDLTERPSSATKLPCAIVQQGGQ